MKLHSVALMCAKCVANPCNSWFMGSRCLSLDPPLVLLPINPTLLLDFSSSSNLACHSYIIPTEHHDPPPPPPQKQSLPVKCGRSSSSSAALCCLLSACIFVSHSHYPRQLKSATILPASYFQIDGTRYKFVVPGTSRTR